MGISLFEEPFRRHKHVRRMEDAAEMFYELCLDARRAYRKAVLQNGMKMDFSFNRTDGRKKKDSHESFTIATEENLQIFEAYFLQKKNIQDLGAIIKSMQSIDKMNLTLKQAEGIIKASKYINKIKSTLE